MQHLTVIFFFYFENAYNTIWKYCIMLDLYDLGLRGKLSLFIINFLLQGNFTVHVGFTLSDLQNQETDIPHRNIQSVTLLIKINNIVKCLSPTGDLAFHVDNFIICNRANHMNIIEWQLQLNLNKINKWITDKVFKFSKSKTQCVHFCSVKKMHNNPVIKLEDTKIPIINEYKFLGVLFDKKLKNYYPHNFCEWLPTQNVELNDKCFLNYADHWSVRNWTMPFFSTHLPGGPTNNYKESSFNGKLHLHSRSNRLSSQHHLKEQT